MQNTAVIREDDEPGELRAGDVGALRELVKLGGGGKFVASRKVLTSQMRRLEGAGFVHLLAGVNGQSEARVTARGLQALASAHGTKTQ